MFGHTGIKTPPENRSVPVLICALLVLVTLGVFWPLHTHEFINLDDRQYISGNPHVLTGLSRANVRWSFQAGYASNWHPLTWLSHMLDVEVFGLEPGWHHLVNVAWHIANTVLLFLLLARLTGAVWRSAAVAALFALHPLHVESVAWAAERKDVLCVFFWLATIAAYATYAKARETNGPNPKDGTPRTWSWYGLAVLGCALALMSKPMAVTLPFTLLLLDYWPLHRFTDESQQAKRLLILSVEKIPFIALTIGSCILTMVAQTRGTAVKAWVPLTVRFENALVSYLKYLGKTFWPAKLAIFYPHHELQPVAADHAAVATNVHLLWTALAAAALLALVSWIAVRQRKSRPWLPVGWFWFLGTLVPVIGLVQVGGQAMADRYTYMPLVGIFIIVAWSATELLGHQYYSRTLLAGGGLAAVLACAVLTRVQLGTWQNTFTVFTHDLKVAGPNAMALNSIGLEYAAQGKFELAMTNLYGAIEADPLFGEAYDNVAFVLGRQGKLNESVAAYETALQVRPWNDWALANLASTLLAMGKREEAVAEAQKAIGLNAENALAHYIIGMAVQENGDLSRAEAEFIEAHRVNPTYPDPLNRLAELQLRQGRLREAEASFREASRLAPHDAQARVNLGGLLWRLGRTDEALSAFIEAIRAEPTHPGAHYNLGFALSAQGHPPEAVAEFREAVRLSPNYLEAWTALGRALAGQGLFADAVPPFREAVRLGPTNSNCQLNLANALWLSGQTNEAAGFFANVRRLDPGLAGQLVQAGKKLLSQGQATTSVARFRVALQIEPSNGTALQELAWLLATAPEPELRNGAEAVQLAERACTLTNSQECRVRGVLDAAYAEAGRFDDAIHAAEQAKSIALTIGDQSSAQVADARLALYRHHQPFRQTR